MTGISTPNKYVILNKQYISVTYSSGALSRLNVLSRQALQQC
jgi:hypothetical protein